MESLTAVQRGSLSFRQCILLRASFASKCMISSSLASTVCGLFYFTLDEAWNSSVTAERSKTTAIVVTLLEHRLCLGHKVWVESFYVSLELVWFMQTKNNCWNFVLTRKTFLLY
jgi:hypothetical protein